MRKHDMLAIWIAAGLFGPIGAFAAGGMAGLVSVCAFIAAVALIGPAGALLGWFASIAIAVGYAEKHNAILGGSTN